jgi:hypothetical protein
MPTQKIENRECNAGGTAIYSKSSTLNFKKYKADAGGRE